MRVRAGMVVVLGAAALAGTPGDALAQTPPTYAGGLLPTAGVPPPGYHPSMGITLQPRGSRIAVRFDSSVRCGRTSFDVTGRRLGSFDGTRIVARDAIEQILGPGRRLLYTWTVTGTAAGGAASGNLHITGALRVRGRRTQSCVRSPDRPWQARLIATPAGAPATPAPGATLVGGSSQAIADRLPGPVVVRVTRDGRASARWTAVADCGRGPSEVFANFTPPRRIAASGALTSDERFSLSFTDAVVRYHAQFTAQFTADGARGTLRLRANVFDRRGRRLRTRCDSRPRTWTALPATAAASALAPGAAPGNTTPGNTTPGPTAPPVTSLPPGTGPVTPGPSLSLVPVTWFLSFTSDPGDPIGMGQTLALDQSSSEMHGAADRRSVGISVNTPGHPETSWGVLVGAPVGTWLAPGTYTVLLSQGGPFPQMSISSPGRGCSGSGTFTVDALTYGADERLRTFVVRFEQHCDGGAPALRGRLEFHGA